MTSHSEEIEMNKNHAWGLWSESKKTSVEAHQSVKEHLPKMKDRVLNVISTRESTDDELEIITGMSHQSLSALVEATGKKRKTRSGRAAQVWRRAWI
jgi:hypothetical protein